MSEQGSRFRTGGGREPIKPIGQSDNVRDRSTDHFPKRNGVLAVPLFLAGVHDRAILDHLPAAIYATDAHGRITYFNEAAVALWGRRPELGVDWWCGSWRLFWPDGRPMAHDECPMAVSLLTGRPVRGVEAVAERPDGTRFPFIPYPTPLYDASGKMTGAINMLVDISEAKKIEDALRQREAEHTDLVENTTVGLHRVGPDGTILWANRAEMDMLGVAPDDYIGHHIAEFHADGPVIDDILHRLAKFETLKDYRARLRCKDGSIKHVLIDSSVYTKNGQFVHTRCFTRDVTAQVLVEKHLAISAAISQILSEAVTIDEAAPAVLETLSEHFDADILELWLGEEKLRCVAMYTPLSKKEVRKFNRVTESLSLAPGEGLPGRVWQAREPISLDQVSDWPNFARHQVAVELGLCTGLGFPILLGKQCLGAVTCFMRRSPASDPSLLNMMASIGLKLGQFIQRTREEEINRDLAAVVEASPDAIVGATMDGVITNWNAGAEHVFGYTADETIGQLLSLIVPKDKESERRNIITRLKDGETVKSFETVRLNKAGDLIPVSISWCGIRDGRDKLISVSAIIRDISERKATEAQLQARVRQLGFVSELGILALASDDLQGLFHQSVTYLARGLDVELAKVLELQPAGGNLLLRAGVGWQDGLVGMATVGAGHTSQAGYTLSVDEPVIVTDLRTETRFSGPNLLFDHGVVSGMSVVIRGESERPFGVLGAHTRSAREFFSDDVHFIQSIANVMAVALERKRYQERQSILVNELSHRVKNILSVTLAMATQSGRRAASIDEFLTSFEGRLQALSRAQDLLTSNQWNSANLLAVAEFVLGDPDELKLIHLDLDELELTPTGAQAVALVLHELMTNAVKYGALSNLQGKITILGRNERNGEARVYRLSWQEDGGPPISKPARSGFGTRLISGMVENQCCGKLAFDWRPEGLSVVIELPEDSIGQS